MAERKAFLLRVDPRVWAALERLAQAELRSVNAQIEFLLRDALVRRGIQNQTSPASGRVRVARWIKTLATALTAAEAFRGCTLRAARREDDGPVCSTCTALRCATTSRPCGGGTNTGSASISPRRTCRGATR